MLTFSVVGKIVLALYCANKTYAQISLSPTSSNFSFSWNPISYSRMVGQFG